VLLLVSPLLAAYGSSSWSWIGGPVASLILFALAEAASDRGSDRTPATNVGHVTIAAAAAGTDPS
jgi:hypothetical protein